MLLIDGWLKIDLLFYAKHLFGLKVWLAFSSALGLLLLLAVFCFE